MMNAISECHDDIVLALIKKKADVNIRDRSGFTALHFASFHGCYDIAEALVKYGAELNIEVKYNIFVNVYL